jgi:hypothetical protein
MTTDDSNDRQEVHRLWASNHLDALFGGHDKTLIPFPRVPRRKGEALYDREAVATLLAQPAKLEPVDPRELHATQNWVVREHAEYYRRGVWELTGRPSADHDSVANRFPVIAIDDRGRKMILTGHHRSAVALLEGRPLLARVVGRVHDPSVAVALTPHLHLGLRCLVDHKEVFAVDTLREAMMVGPILVQDGPLADALADFAWTWAFGEDGLMPSPQLGQLTRPELIELTPELIREVAHFSHPIPLGRGFHLQWLQTHTPLWTWNELIDYLRERHGVIFNSSYGAGLVGFSPTTIAVPRTPPPEFRERPWWTRNSIFATPPCDSDGREECS